MVDLFTERVEILESYRDRLNASADDVRTYALALVRSAAKRNDLEDVKAVLAALDQVLGY